MGDGHELTGAVTRRQVLRDLGAAGLGLGVLGSGLEGWLASAAAAAPKTGSLKDIDHVVILIQENRSFDHYFGTLSGVRGFDDHKGRAAFTQVGVNGKKLHPFHLPEDCLPDLTHEWGPQHQAWNRGRMDEFLRTHEQVDVPPSEPAGTGPETMGYYKRSDLPFYYGLADAFTICDGYHCSVIGPTDPNRLMSMSASIDPAGKHGGPLVETLVATRASMAGHFTWTTMPERLQAHGVSWKVYTSPSGGILDNVLTYFKPYTAGSKLAARGLVPTFPNDFMNDLSQGHLPQVSWLLTAIAETEHPGFSGAVSGEIAARQIIEALISHPKTWARTALFITWDENGGFFDHVAPPTPPKGTKGEFLTVSQLPSAASGVRGPVGLGFRVPMLVVSPFSRGGLVCSDVCDHTSTLRFLETRFRVPVPNLTAWRRSVTGDLTSAFNFAAKPRVSRPALPNPGVAGVCASRAPVTPTSGPIPHQEKGKRRRPSGIVKHH
jgi:phospholipase C